MIKIFIPFALPTLNEQINTARKNKYASASLKKKFDRKIKHEILTQLNPIPYYNSIELDLVWVETKKKRDPDNVFAGIKFILDSIVNVKILPDDTRDQVKKISNSIRIEENRGVEVTIIES